MGGAGYGFFEEGGGLWDVMWNGQKLSLAGSWCVVGDGENCQFSAGDQVHESEGVCTRVRARCTTYLAIINPTLLPSASAYQLLVHAQTLASQNRNQG
jgi:hypothetical protein